MSWAWGCPKHSQKFRDKEMERKIKAMSCVFKLSIVAWSDVPSTKRNKIGQIFLADRFSTAYLCRGETSMNYIVYNAMYWKIFFLRLVGYSFTHTHTHTHTHIYIYIYIYMRKFEEYDNKIEKTYHNILLSLFPSKHSLSLSKSRGKKKPY